MIRPDDKTVKALAIVARQYPEVMSWLEQWRTHERVILTLAVKYPALAQGRCQDLGELNKVVKDSPEIVAAKSL
jgi:hypothetical protein